MAEPNAVNPRGAGLKFDGGKPRPGLLIEGMPRALARVADVLTFGANKYQAHSWKQVENGRERYHDAKVRHQLALAGGEVFDAESGIEHLAHEACNVLFLLELALIEKENQKDEQEKHTTSIQTTLRHANDEVERRAGGWYSHGAPVGRAGECI